MKIGRKAWYAILTAVADGAVAVLCGYVPALEPAREALLAAITTLGAAVIAGHAWTDTTALSAEKSKVVTDALADLKRRIEEARNNSK
ncbi:MAG: hypothetical protein ABIK89_05015 [Planctomycetota bacterium]